MVLFYRDSTESPGCSRVNLTTCFSGQHNEFPCNAAVEKLGGIIFIQLGGMQFSIIAKPRVSGC